MFPEEAWMMVLGYLRLEDLCKVALVSRFFYRLATDPCLWKWAGSRLNKEKVRTNGLVTLFKIPRFKKLNSVDISESTPSACVELIHFLTCPASQDHKLKEVNLRYVNLSAVPAKSLSAAVSLLRKVDLEFTQLTGRQCTAIARQLHSSSSLVELSLADVDLSTLSSLSCHLLTRDKAALNKLNLEYSNLRADQCSTILRTIIRCSSIRDLNLGGVNLSQVKSCLLGEAATVLEKVNLRNCDLTKRQCTTILSQITRTGRLVELNQCTTTLHSQITKTGRLVELNQCTTTLHSQITRTGRLVELNLSENDLSSQRADLLVSAVTRLHSVDLENCWLSMEQCSALLLASMAHTCLRDLKLGGNELLDTRFSHVNVPGFSIMI